MKWVESLQPLGNYTETISELKTAALVDLGHKNSFDLLLKEAWNPEQAAMGNSTTICGKLNIMASIAIYIMFKSSWNREGSVSRQYRQFLQYQPEPWKRALS